MRRDQVVEGAELYFASGPQWRHVPPKRVTVVDPGPYRIVSTRQGPFTFVQHHRDDAGTAVLVRFDGESTNRAVYRRDLRGPWLEMLAATGRSVAGVKAHGALISEIAGSGRDVTTEDLLRVAACDEGQPDDVFGTLANHIEGE